MTETGVRNRPREPKPNGSSTMAKTTKTAAAATETASTAGPTVRERTFKLIAKTPMTGPAIKEKLQLAGVPSFLKDEGVCAKPRIKRAVVEGVRGVVYSLTALGAKDLAAGKVDENAADASSGQEWPNGK